MRQVLWGRRLPVTPTCSMCLEEDELVAHLLRDCRFSKQVLVGVGMPFLSTNMYNGWKQWLVEAFTRYNIVDCRKLAISYWALWFTRNKLYHEGIRDSVHDMVSFINAYFLETE